MNNLELVLLELINQNRSTVFVVDRDLNRKHSWSFSASTFAFEVILWFFTTVLYCLRARWRAVSCYFQSCILKQSTSYENAGIL